MGRKNPQGGSGAAPAAAATERGKGKRTKEGSAGRKERRSGREQRKVTEAARGEEEEEEGGAPVAAGEQFFKVYFPEQSAVRLKIPPAFHEYVKEAPDRVVSLKGPSGHTWEVVLTSGSQGLSFTQGWKEFACDHSLLAGHFMVFTYDGQSEFSVDVFSASGVKDKAAPNVEPRKEPVIKQEEEQDCVVDMDALDTPQVSADLPPVEVDRRNTRKRVRQMNDAMEGDTALKTKGQSSAQKKHEKRKPKAAAGTSSSVPTVSDSNKDYPCMLDEFSSSKKTRIKSKDMPRMGKFVSRKHRQPVIISQRRLVTEEEKNHALKRANEFKSRNPFSVQVMMESYVYVGFFMNIPCDFVRKILPRTNKKMILWDPQGKSWEVNYVYYTDRSVAAFSGGWGKFALGNNLEKFDVCVFELFKEDNFKVHIYRVVPEITPLIRKTDM